jgi:hypothetical protein
MHGERLHDMRRLATLGFLLGLVTLTAMAADFSGKWVAQTPGRDGQIHESTFTFKVDGETVTGTVKGARGEAEISDGKISGDQISFSQTMEFNGNQMKILYKGTISGDQINFTRMREGGQGGGGQGRKGMGSTQFTAKRVS